VYIFKTVQNVAYNFFTLNISTNFSFHTQRGPGAKAPKYAPGVADILRKSPNVDPSPGLIYTHPAHAGSCVRPAAVAAVAADCGVRQFW